MKTSSLAKKIAACVVSVALMATMVVSAAFTTMAAGSSATLSVDKTEASAGETVTVTVELNEIYFGSLQCDLYYDADAVTFTSGTIDSSRSIAMYNDNGDRITTGDMSLTNVTYSGTYFVAVFTVNDDVKPGTTFTFSYDIYEVGVNNEGGAGVTVTTDEVKEAVGTIADVSVTVPAETKIYSTVSTESAAAGDTVTVDVYVEDLAFSSLMFDVTYDEDVLTYVSTTFNDSVIGESNDLGGTVKLGVITTADVTLSDAVATVTFTVKSDATEGDVGTITTTLTEFVQAEAEVTDDMQVYVGDNEESVTVAASATSSDDTSSDDTSSSDTSSDTSSTTTTGTTTEGTSMYVTTDTGSTVLVTIPEGATVTVLEDLGDGWLYVSYNGYEGYVLATAVEVDNNTSSATSSDTSSTTSGTSSTGTSSTTGTTSTTSTTSGTTSPTTGVAAPIALIAFFSVIALAGVVAFAKKGFTE